MIRPQEIEEKSGQLGVPISAIERDYVQNWILKHLRAIDMVLKGGTGIRKVYFENYRFSDDLDFTLLDEVEIDELNEQITNAAERTQEESGISIINSGIKSNDNGYIRSNLIIPNKTERGKQNKNKGRYYKEIE
ncbi:nucleotidyl transferase AbiEii/AbiGii toxin family protein [Mesotoga sp. UBA5847]|jgi:predicted nucleotidyltransferase component of viral defense system|uniref:nucleotidyl transferase AbiEii/AbiGii toxin family protein n=1 Tax=Mesotoga sp. UBA5847 TaxID=1946859 RepID=UPI0025DD5754|nr:nucleotidyl transferase AbiEii/AbiGii toxin family protein [Mesotoga sp. UBA5847]